MAVMTSGETLHKSLDRCVYMQHWAGGVHSYLLERKCVNCLNVLACVLGIPHSLPTGLWQCWMSSFHDICPRAQQCIARSKNEKTVACAQTRTQERVTAATRCLQSKWVNIACRWDEPLSSSIKPWSYKHNIAGTCTTRWNIECRTEYFKIFINSSGT